MGREKMYAQFYSIPEEINSASANPCKNAIRILQCAEEYSFLINLRTQKIAFAVKRMFMWRIQHIKWCLHQCHVQLSYK